MRFARENTNDQGKRMQFESAEEIIGQFKIYVIGVYEILQKNNQLEQSESAYIVAPFMPPHIVTRVWEALMTYTHSYLAFCEEIFGKGKILVHNNEPNMKNCFDHYKNFQEKIVLSKKGFEFGLEIIFPKFTIQ